MCHLFHKHDIYERQDDMPEYCHQQQIVITRDGQAIYKVNFVLYQEKNMVLILRHSFTIILFLDDWIGILCPMRRVLICVSGCVRIVLV